MAPADDDQPQWRLDLRRIPESELSSTQRDMARAMDIIDELTATYASSAPPPSPSSPSTDRALVAALETMAVSFRGNVAYSLLPLSLYTVIMPEGVIKAAFERAFAQMNGMTVPTAPRETVLFIAERLLTCVFAIKPAGMMQKGSAAPMVMGLSMLEGLLGTLPRSDADAALAALGTRLTLADLRAVWLYARAVYMLEADAGGAVQQCTRSAVRDVFDALERGPLCWYLMSSYAQIFDRAAKAQGLGPVNEVRVRVLRRYLKAAEAEGDPFRRGWCAGDLAMWIMGAGAAYVEVEALAQQAAEAREEARLGLPPLLIASGFRLLGDVLTGLERFREKYPDTYRELGVKMGGEMEVSAAPPPGDLQQCGACGTEGKGMGVCTGVSLGGAWLLAVRYVTLTVPSPPFFSNSRSAVWCGTAIGHVRSGGGRTVTKWIARRRWRQRRQRRVVPPELAHLPPLSAPPKISCSMNNVMTAKPNLAAHNDAPSRLP